jgi:hypothetical protein
MAKWTSIIKGSRKGFPLGWQKNRKVEGKMNWEKLRDELLKTYKDIEFQAHVNCQEGKWVEEILVETETDAFYIKVAIINYSEEVEYNDFLYQL